MGKAAAGRAGSFNPEEQRSSRFRSYGPPLREERYRSFRSCTNRPDRRRPGPCRTTWAGGRRAGVRCGQSDEDKIGGFRRIGVHDRSCRVSHGGN